MLVKHAKLKTSRRNFDKSPVRSKQIEMGKGELKK